VIHYDSHPTQKPRQRRKYGSISIMIASSNPKPHRGESMVAKRDRLTQPKAASRRKYGSQNM